METNLTIQTSSHKNPATIHDLMAQHNCPDSVPRTLMDLLTRLTERGTPNLPALRSKASVLSDILRRPADQITIDDIDYAKCSLRPHLASRRLAENSIRTYVNEVQVLLNNAKALGWVPGTNIPAAWQVVVESCKEAKCDDLCRYLIRRKRTPKQVTTEDIEAWIAEYVGLGKAWSTARRKSSAFRRVLFACGQIAELPAILQNGFGISLDEFPGGLKEEVLEILRWKQAKYAVTRPKRGKLRAESAGNLKRAFSELFGFAVNVCDMTSVNSISGLVTPEVISRYIDWAINQRRVRGQSVHSRLVVLKAALGQHPRYKDFDVIWLHNLIEGIPIDSPSELREKQAAKQIDYGAVEAIPARIHAERKLAAKQSEKHLALAVRNELLMLWLTVLPWRQRNIRECRIDGPRPNIFKAAIKPYAPIAKPSWVEDALRTNPEAEFWQFRFAPEETKVGNGVHALVPRPLIPLLEEYISSHRQVLLQDSDSECLFLSEAGTMISRARMTIIVGELTLRHIGKRITPHAFRHIVAYAWLDAHPDDYLTLSKILFHTNINTTLRCYGARFNESNGACGMERWVESRRQKGAYSAQSI